MERFLALSWHAASEAATAQAKALLDRLPEAGQAWRVLLRTEGLRVLAVDAPGKPLRTTPIDAATGSGVVVGPLFARGAEQRGHAGVMDRKRADEVLASSGATLVAEHWGRYVAIWADAATQRVFVLRDPGAGLPCFYRSLGAVTVAGSWICDLARWGGRQPSTDWRGVQAFLLNNNAVLPTTALEGVGEVLPGERVCWTRGRLCDRAPAWSGHGFASHPKPRKFAEARRELRDTFTACLTAWSRISGQMMVRLSGGFDSSVLASLLASIVARTGDAPLLALHFRSEGYEGHEGDLARLVASKSGIELIELDVAPDDLRGVLAAPLLPRPTRQVFGFAADRAVRTVCAERSVDTILAGHGGDAVLLQRSLAVRVLADWLLAHGPRPALAGAAYAAAVLLERPVVVLLREAIDAIAFRRQASPQEARNRARRIAASFVEPEAASAFGDDVWRHPWLSGKPTLPPCKSDQLAAIGALANYRGMLESAHTRQTLNPYASQPMIEFALSTPAFTLTHGGEDRALARSGFAGFIPDAVRRRTGKGFINNRLLTRLQANLPFARQLVMDGELVRQPWARRRDIERALGEEAVMAGRNLTSLLSLIAAEAWLQSWRPSL